LAGLLANGTQATGSVRLSLLWMHDLPLLLRQVQCRGEGELDVGFSFLLTL
jgi:hypothetical protein